MDYEPSNSLASATTNCLQSFDTMLHSLRTATNVHCGCLPEKALSNQKARLSVWARNVGALQSGNSALDVRLQGFSVMKRATIQCFEQLEQVIHSSTEILQGRRLPLEQTLAEFGELWDSASDDSFDLGDKEYRKTELGQNLVEMSSILSDLFKLSFKLRNTASRSTGPSILRAIAYQRVVKVGESDDSFEVDIFGLYAEFDRAYAEDLIAYWRWDSWLKASPQRLSATTSDSQGKDSDDAREVKALVVHRSLIERWIRSITNRRRMFAYWERHAKKLARADGDTTAPELAPAAREPVEPITVSESRETLEPSEDRKALHVADTSAFSNTEHTLVNRDLDAVSHTRSTISRISTAYNIDETASHLPPAPVLDRGQLEARCPYCHIVCPAKEFQHSRWRKHIIQDLQPYMCTWDDCPDADTMYGTRSAWLSHEAQVHRRVFRCVNHPELFLSRDSFRNHLLSSHQDLGEGQIEAMMDFGQASHSENRVSCPFCLSEGPVLRGLPNHMAYHQERLACFSATRQSLDQETGLSSDTDSDKAQGDSDPDPLELLESEASSEQSSINTDSEEPEKSQVQTTLSLGKVIRQALIQSSCPDEDPDPEPAIRFPAPKYLPIDELNRIINRKSVSDELNRLELLEEPELSSRASEILGEAGFSRQEELDRDQTDSSGNALKYPTRKKIFACLVLLGKVAAITQVVDEGLSDADLPFNLDPDRVKLVKRDRTFSEPVAAFQGWMEHEAYMFYTYQWYMLAPYFLLADDDEPRIIHYTMSLMIPLPFSVNETVINGDTSSVCEYLEQFWARNPPGNDAVDMTRWISSQLFGLADALQLIRDLFPSEVLAENGHRLQPPHRDLSPEHFGSMQYHDDQAYHQRGSEICTDSAYRAPELLTVEMAPDSDLWSFGCIILHFIVWYHGGWALVNSLSASSSAEEEEEGSDDDKFFKCRNLDVTRSSLDPQGLREEGDGSGVNYPNTVVLKESIKQEISKFLDQGNSRFVRDTIGLAKRDLLKQLLGIGQVVKLFEIT
ncbi:meiosis-specific serine threonine kinase mek1 [Fusarium sp. NRRL 52700]|nr:meiosis-specific serine threonine kinase mek1 [Fusarium sp. NRRL 52700]